MAYQAGATKFTSAMRTAALSLGIAMAGVSVASAAPVNPVFDVFGELTGATFGGTGIPNDPVAITQFDDGGTVITLGLGTNGRFSNPTLDDDGAGTYTGQTGANTGGSPLLGATWNFNYYIDINGGTISDYVVELLYDFDPGVDTDETLHGVIDFGAAGAGGLSHIEDSQNLLFDFLSSNAIPGLTPPPGTFDPNVAGEYSFALRVSAIGGGLLGESAIVVNVVPEPGTMTVLGMGLAGLLAARRRYRR